MASIEDLRRDKIEQINKIKGLGINPYSPESKKDYSNKHIVDNFDEFEDKKINLTGRVTSWREHGAIVFADLSDESGTIQLYIREDTLEDTNAKKQIIGFENIGLLGEDDFVQAYGVVTKTKTGEISLKPHQIKILAKAVRPIPDKNSGLKDVEERYRKRYLDFIINPKSKKIIDTRWEIEKEIRMFLWGKGFKEVETPILQSLYGGTNAKPFTTTFNALDCDFYLRIAPELYLKRLIVGGYEKVFEIARNFRNEGIDQTHFPEFTMLEWYEAYADYHRVMDLAEDLIKHLVKKLTGDLEIKVHGTKIDISGKWSRKTVDELLKEYLDIDWEKITEKETKDLLKKHNVQIRGVWDKDKALFAIYDHLVTPKLIDPIWAIDYPQAISPLSKSHRTKEGRAERFEGYIGGVEVFDGWSEIISGLEQRKRFENEQKNMKKGDDEAMPLDEDFIEALEYGCPPLGGIGFGIDRLVMFLTDVWSIKEVVAFPILKSKNNVVEKSDSSAGGNSKTENEDKDKDGDMDEGLQVSDGGKIPTRKEAQRLLEKYVKDGYQRLHAKMVANVLEKYADKYGEDTKLWYATGLLHDLDFEEYPDDHPSKSLEWFEEWGYSKQLIHAVGSHFWKKTNIKPQTKLAFHLIATDELAGILYAYFLMRPTGFDGMKSSKVKKKFKDKTFAAKIDREEILFGIKNLDVDFAEHVNFVIDVLSNMDELEK